MTPPNPLLSVENLALSRGGRQLFAGLGFTLSAGEILLLTGPNGAGKSSLLLALAGVLRPAGGTIHWERGEPPPLHLLAHHNAVKSRLTLGENLGFWQALNGTTGIATDAALEAVGLGGLSGIEAGHLSAGQTRRLALARLLVSTRALWLLDEPAASLDTEGDRLVARLLATHVAAGGAAIVATHAPVAGATRTLRLGAAA